MNLQTICSFLIMEAEFVKETKKDGQKADKK